MELSINNNSLHFFMTIYPFNWLLSLASTTAFGIRPVIRMLNSILMLLLLYPLVVLCNGKFVKVTLPPGAMGPDAIAFDYYDDEGPYTGVADGRILKFEAHTGFVDYGSSSPNRSEALCDGHTDPGLIKECGRPLGMDFYYKTGELYVCDAVFGLVVVPRYGGPAAQVVTEAEGLPIHVAVDVDVDEPTGAVYFTDASSRYNISQIAEAVAANDSTGRLLKYDPYTKRVTVLLKGLSGAAGVAVSRNGDFLLLTEFIAGRVKKYWIKGPKATRTETLVTFPGLVDHMKRDRFGNYWIAVNYRPIPSSPTAVKIDAKGRILAKKLLLPEYKDTSISTVMEYEGDLYVGSLDTSFIGKYYDI